MNKKLLPAFFLTFVNVLGFSILMPVLPFIVSHYGAPKWVYGLIITAYSAFQFIGAPILGNLSDSQGRKKILIISQLGTLLCWILFAFALHLPTFPIWGLALPLWVIMGSRILDGITGGNTSVANAYVADITTHKEKSYIFGYLGGITGIAMIIGPGLGGLSSSTVLGFKGTIYLSILISTLTLLSIFFWLKESLPPEKRNPNPTKHSIVKSFIVPLTIARLEAPPLLKLLLNIKGIVSAMMALYISSIALFIIDLFEFNETQLGTFMFIVGAFLSFNQAFMSKRFIRKFGELNTLKIGLIFSFLGLFSITLTQNFYAFVGFYYIMNLGISLIMPTFGALISQQAPEASRGRIMGISESVQSFSMAIFPIMGASLYGVFGSHFYWGLSLFPFMALILLLWKAPKV